MLYRNDPMARWRARRCAPIDIYGYGVDQMPEQNEWFCMNHNVCAWQYQVQDVSLQRITLRSHLLKLIRVRPSYNSEHVA